MDNDKKTSNALLVVLATFVVTIAFLGVVIEYFDKDKEIVTTFWAPPWTVALEADVEDVVGMPDMATLSINNEGTKELYARQPMLIFAKNKDIQATAAVDNSTARSFSVDSEKEKSITVDLSSLRIETLDGELMSPSELDKGKWTVQAVFYVMREDSMRPRMAWSGPLNLNGTDKKEEPKTEEATE